MATEKDLKVGVRIDVGATGLDQIERTRAGVEGVGDSAVDAAGKTRTLTDALDRLSGELHPAPDPTEAVRAGLDGTVRAAREAQTALNAWQDAMRERGDAVRVIEREGQALQLAAAAQHEEAKAALAAAQAEGDETRVRIAQEIAMRAQADTARALVIAKRAEAEAAARSLAEAEREARARGLATAAVDKQLAELRLVAQMRESEARIAQAAVARHEHEAQARARVAAETLRQAEAAQAARAAAEAEAAASKRAADLAAYDARMEAQAQQQVADARGRAVAQARRAAEAAEVEARAYRGASQAAGHLREAVGLIGAGAIVKGFVDANASAQNLEKALRQLAGGEQAAAKEIAYLHEASKRLGLSLNEITPAYVRLYAATQGTSLAGDTTRQVFEALAGAMSLLGRSSAETSEALLAVEQMVSKNKVSSEELKQQLGEKLPGATKIAAQALGITTSQLEKLLESGNLLATDFLPRFAPAVQKAFGLSKEPVQGFTAEMGRLKTVTAEAYERVGDAGAFKVAEGAVKFAQLAFGGLAATTVFLGQSIGNLVGAFAHLDFSGYQVLQKEIFADLVKGLKAAAGATDETKQKQDGLTVAANASTTAIAGNAEALGDLADYANKAQLAKAELITQLGIEQIRLDQHKSSLDAQNAAEQAAAEAAQRVAQARGDEAAMTAAAVVAAQQAVVANDREAGSARGYLQVAEQRLQAERDRLALMEIAGKASADELKGQQERVTAAQVERDQRASTLGQLQAEGVARREVAKAASIEAAARLDLLRKAEAETQVTEAGQSARVAEARATLDIARAKNNEAAVRRATIALARAEADQARAVARAKQAEAQAARDALVRADAEAKAKKNSAWLTSKERDELVRTVAVKDAAATASGAAADAADAEAKAKARSTDQINQNTDATDRNTEAKQRNAGQQQQQTAQTVAATNAFADFTAVVTGYSIEAAKLFDSNLHAQGLRELSTGLGGVAAQAAHGGDSLADMRAQLAALNAETHAGGANETDSNIAAWGRAANATAREILEARIEVAELEKKFADGTATAGDLARAVGVVRDRTKLLGEERLSGLNSAISSFRQSVQGLNSDLQSTLQRLEDQNAQLRGNAVEVERLRYVRERAEIEEQARAAQRAGDAEAIAAAARAQRLSAENHRLTLAQIAEQRRAERRRATEQRTEAATAPATSGPSNAPADALPAAAAPAPTQVVRMTRVQLVAPNGRRAEIDTPETSADAVVRDLVRLFEVTR